MNRNDRDRRLREGYFEGSAGRRTQFEFDDANYHRMGGSFQTFRDESRRINDIHARHYNYDNFGYGDTKRSWYTNLDNQDDYRRDHYGKGPKGYHRSVDSIKDDIWSALYEADSIDATDIEVDVDDGIVTLSGVVNSEKEKREVERLIENIFGVEDIMNMLRTQGEPGPGWQPHGEIAA